MSASGRTMPGKKSKTVTSDALEILHRRYYEGRPARLRSLKEARENEEIARRIRELRAAMCRISRSDGPPGSATKALFAS